MSSRPLLAVKASKQVKLAREAPNQPTNPDGHHAKPRGAWLQLAITKNPSQTPCFPASQHGKASVILLARACSHLPSSLLLRSSPLLLLSSSPSLMKSLVIKRSSAGGVFGSTSPRHKDLLFSTLCWTFRRQLSLQETRAPPPAGGSVFLTGQSRKLTKSSDGRPSGPASFLGLRCLCCRCGG